MPRMVHFSTGICLSDCGVLKGFLEEFLRRAEIRTLLKWGNRPTQMTRVTWRLASSALFQPSHVTRWGMPSLYSLSAVLLLAAIRSYTSTLKNYFASTVSHDLESQPT